MPNKEIGYIYTTVFEEWFKKQITGHKDAFIKALMNEEISKVNEIINNYDEKYYHGSLSIRNRV